MSILVAAFYRFVPLSDPAALQVPLRDLCEANDVLGTVLLATEGINGTIAGRPEDIEAVFGWLRATPGLENLQYQPSFAQFRPFDRMKVRLKAEIVALKTDADPLAVVGEYVEPEDWNALITRPDVVVVDTRNTHEVAMGTFVGAVDPKTATFGEFPEFVDQQLDPDQPIAMFCTGGIRCEKATSYLRAKGFSRVYHLKGGILSYLARVPESDSQWQGDCFIFDQRQALDHQLQPRFADAEEARAHLSEGWAPRVPQAAD